MMNQLHVLSRFRRTTTPIRSERTDRQPADGWQLGRPRFGLLCLSALALLCTPAALPAQSLQLNRGDRISIIGNSLAERLQHDGWLETYLQAAHPDYELVFRNLGVSGDQVHHRPRAHDGFGDPDRHLVHNKTTVVFAFFGYNESYDDDPGQFKGHLRDWIDHTLEQRYDGENPPRIVLFSPIAHENLDDPNLPDGLENNRRLAAYAEAMAEVAEEKGVTHVDLYAASQTMYAQASEPLTINGVHLNTDGNRQIAEVITEALFGGLEVSLEQLEFIREAVLDKNWHWFHRYRAPSGNDVWGGRSDLHGNFETLQQELRMLDVMTANRDQRVWARARGEDLEIDDSNVPPPDEVETNYHRDIRFLGGEEAIDEMHLADGLKIDLFACEQMFPEIANPVQLQVDTRGRLWVAAWPTYPKWEPLKEMNDGLFILEDTSGDGKADKITRFAYVHNPTGFEFWNNGVIVASAPYLIYLQDTTGDNQADVRIKLMGGIDHADTHHTANNLIYGPDGYIYYQRGVFHRHNVETPWQQAQTGTASALYRFNPRTHHFEMVVDNSPNPHGISFDRWGYQYITDGTSGRPFQVYLDGDRFRKRAMFEQTVRPVPGNQVLVSEHLPEEFWDNFLIYNVIGFLGIKRYELSYDNGVVTGQEIGDLIYSDDGNFRPTHGVVGPEGALYISDWHNPIIGHMQHNLRDPSRDHDHGRIYRITAAADRPFQDPVDIDGEPIEDLLELLRHPVDGIRHRVRIELSGRETHDVIQAVQRWADQWDANDPEHALPLLEALWLHQQHNVVNRELLEKVKSSPVEHAQVAAQRVAYHFDRDPTAGVWRELLVRSEVPEEQRRAAVAALAEIDNLSELAVLLRTIDHIDSQPGVEDVGVVTDLLRLLAGRTAGELAQARDDLQRLAREGRQPLIRQVAMITLIEVDGSVEPTWQWASRSAGSLRDLVSAVPLITDPSLRASLYEPLVGLLDGLPGELADDGPSTPGFGRYVRIELPRQGTLTLAEVEVYSGGRNVASEGNASQINTAHGGEASRAIDGNTSGSYGDGGQTHTRENTQNPWWEVDLQEEYPIERIVVYNRTDGELGQRLDGFTLRVLDSDREELFRDENISAPEVRVEFDLEIGSESVIRRQAMTSLTSIRGRETEVFQTLANFAHDDVDRLAAIRAMQRIPSRFWPEAAALPLLDVLIEDLRELSEDERTEQPALDRLEFADTLAALLPVERAREVRAALRELGVHVVRIGTLPERMLYDKDVLAIQAGQPVEFIFENPDLMPHNFVIVEPGALDEVSELAEATGSGPDAIERQYVPESDRILLASRMLQSQQTERLPFEAPSQPGVYPFVCTYPGHTARMFGALYVVDDLDGYLADPEAYLASNPLPIHDERLVDRRPRTDWKFEDLVHEVTSMDGGRSFGNARQMFEVASCTACHQMNDAGHPIGPDLSELDPQPKREELLQKLIEPSEQINEDYRSWSFLTIDGRVITGMILEESEEQVKVLEDPLASQEPTVLPVSEIDERLPSPNSIMPKGLIDQLTREEVLDLVAYLIAQGNADHPLFQGSSHDHHGDAVHHHPASSGGHGHDHGHDHDHGH